MIDPLFFLGLSILLVAVSLTAVLVVALPALQEVARAARSAEKLFDTLRRELPPTLEAIRLTGMEISDLTDDVSDGVKSAGQVVKRVDQSIDSARKQAQKVQTTTRSLLTGVKAAWKSFNRVTSSTNTRRSAGRLSGSTRSGTEARLDLQGYPKRSTDSSVEEEVQQYYSQITTLEGIDYSEDSESLVERQNEPNSSTNLNPSQTNPSKTQASTELSSNAPEDWIDDYDPTNS